MPKFKFDLGDKVKDTITGFEGVITGQTEWLTGCNSCGVQDQKLREGKPSDNQWFDENRLVLIKKTKVSVVGNPMVG